MHQWTSVGWMCRQVKRFEQWLRRHSIRMGNIRNAHPRANRLVESVPQARLMPHNTQRKERRERERAQKCEDPYQLSPSCHRSFCCVLTSVRIGGAGAGGTEHVLDAAVDCTTEHRYRRARMKSALYTFRGVSRRLDYLFWFYIVGRFRVPAVSALMKSTVPSRSNS